MKKKKESIFKMQERKEQDCFNEIQITQNSLVASEALKVDGMTIIPVRGVYEVLKELKSVAN